MSRLHAIIEKKARRKRKLEKGLQSIKEQLIQMGARKIILFGSMAQGNIDVDSDLDLLVVMPATASGREWQRYIYDHIKRHLASDILVYNETEFQEYGEASFVENALKSGRVIYEKA